MPILIFPFGVLIFRLIFTVVINYRHKLSPDFTFDMVSKHTYEIFMWVSMDSFLTVCRAYCAARGCAMTTLSKEMLYDARRLDAMAEQRGSITVDRLVEAMRWLSREWPDDRAKWPYNIARPDPDVG